MSNQLDNNVSANQPQHGVKGMEVFVGGLAPTVTEAQIREVFITCGEIVEIRMIKDCNGKSKGYCFLKFSSREAAVKAVKEKSGFRLEGRKIGVRPSMEQNSLFLGNLPKEWSADEFDSLVRQVFHDVVSTNLVILLSNGAVPSNKQQNRGFGFVQFSSHAVAATAYRMGSRSDFVLGSKCHPTVKWAEEEPEIDPEELAKVKVAFIKSLPIEVNEDFLKKLFAPYGEIEKVVLSKKDHSQVGFVHFAERPDLDNAVKEMNDTIVQRPNTGSFKLQVEVARPIEQSKKRAREGSSAIGSNAVSQSKLLKAESALPFSSGPALKVIEEPVVADRYEAAVVSLPVTVKDRLLRILRLGIATRYDIDIQCLTSLKDIPESAAISVLDQFLLSGADEIDKGAFLAGLIAKYRVRSLGKSGIPEYISKSDIASSRSDLVELYGRSQVPSRIPDYTSRTSDIASSRTDLVELYGRSQVPSRLPDYVSRTSDIASLRSDLVGLAGRSQVPSGIPEYSSRTSDIASLRSDLVGLAGRSQVLSRIPDYTSRTSDIVSLRSDSVGLAGRSQVPVADSPSSRVSTFISRYESYSPRLSYLNDYSPSPRVGITRTTDDRNASPLRFSGSPPSYGRAGPIPPTAARSTSQQASRPRVRFDPFTGEPYKFDPFTGEPIQPESLSSSGGSIY